jgi:amino acid adenylation domain-containing protein
MREGNDMQGRTRVIEGFRLSPQQKQLWRLQQDSLAYYAQCAILIEGDIESGALEEALKKILRKHEILRTTLDWIPGLETPFQLILENPPLPYRRVDLNEKESGDIETVMGALFREESRPFELKRGLLARFCLSQLSASRQVLLISLHALCADGWTLRNLFKEITGFYAAELEGKELIDEPVQYLQFSEWQNELLEEKSDEAQINGREPGFSAPELMSPLESSRAEDSESNRSPFFPESAAFMLDPRMTSRIEAFSGARGSSVSGFLLACWQILLWRLSAEEEIIVECLFDGRQFDELHDGLGLFARYLPVRGTFVPDLRFDETVDRAMISLRQAHLSQEFFLRDSATREAADRINAVSFEYEEWPEAKQVGPVRFSYWKQYFCLDRFKLKLGGYCKTEGLTIEIQYDPTVFSRESVELFQERHLRLIESAVERGEALIGDLEIIGRRELERLLVAWNRTEEKELDSDYLHELIAGQARLRPESIAVIYNEEQLSYGGLEGRANQLANRLRSLGVGPDCIVGLYLERSTEMIIGLLGILKAGGAYLPLEIGQPVERLLVMLEDAGARVIVTKPDAPGNLPLDGREVVMLYDGCQQIAAQSREAPKVAVDPQNLAYVIYTSGSTGKPKGVMVRHGAVVNLWEWLKGAIYEGEGAAPTVSLNAPLAFDASVKQVVQLGSGARLCIVPEEERLDAEFMLAYLRRNEVEVLDCTPSQLRMLVEAGLGKGEGYSKVVLVGGEEIDRQSWGELSESREIKYYNVYGPTECTVDATACRVCVGMEPTIGRPIRNTQIYILDERGEVAPTGVVGEIYIGGTGLARGYLGAAGMTAEKFTPNPFGSRDGERLYRTGDLGRYLLDGRIAYEGRRDEQVKVRGHRIELGEIEEVLRSYPGVSEAVVTLREDELRQRELVGYVVENAKGRMADLREEELRRYVRERLPSYMDLAAIVVMKELPLTKNGKVDRRTLPKPEAVRSEAQIEERRPRNAYEEIISGIWKQVLKVDPVRPGDNFFEIGGHSLLATQVISRVRNAFEVKIGVISIFQDATVEGLALRVEEAIKKGEKDAAPPLARVSREGSLPLSFAQQRLWFIDQLEPGNVIYNCPGAVRVEGQLNLEALERAINEIVRRHEVLRTRIEVKEGKPAQVIDEWKYQRIEVEDLTSLSGEKREEEAGRMAQEEAVTGFDLSRGPLLRVKVLKLEEERHVALYTMHHIVSDGWSMGILIREVGALYRAYSSGEESPLAELPIQYADFAVWQRRWLQGEVIENHLAYWKRQLGGELPVLELPTDRPRPARPTHRGAQFDYGFSTTLSASLNSLSLEHNCTLFMTLLAAFKTLLYYLTGQTDIVVGTDIANRDRAEVENLIGFFVNQLVLRQELSPNSTFVELLKKVRAMTLEAYTHQDLPFEMLVETLNPDRDESRTPLFQVKIVLQNAGVENLSLPGLTLTPVGGEISAAKFDLVLNLYDIGGGIGALLEYSADLFEESTARRMLNRFHSLLERIVDRPGAKLQELVEPLIEEDRGEQLKKDRELENVLLRKFKSARRRAINER